MLTVKLPIQNYQTGLDPYLRQYNSVLRFSFNRLLESKTLLETSKLIKTMLHTELLDVSCKEGALLEAQELIKTGNTDKVIFGGKDNFTKRSKKKISKQEFENAKQAPFTIKGKANQKGNRKFNLDIINSNSIVFKPAADQHFTLQLPHLGKQYQKMLYTLDQAANANKVPVTIGFNKTHVTLTFDELVLREMQAAERQVIPGRFLGLDSNPNSIGYFIEDSDGTILKKEVISFYGVNKFDVKGLPSTDPLFKYKNNKRQHELFEACKRIMDLAEHFQVESVVLENLYIRSKDHKKGRAYNRLVNNSWLRRDLFNNLRKRCRILNIEFIGVPAQYSSFIGAFMYKSDVDSIAAAMELVRRARALKSNDRLHEVFPEWNWTAVANQWKEELPAYKGTEFHSWKDFYEVIKKSGMSYRLSYPEWLRSHKGQVCRMGSYKSLMTFSCMS